ncbi:nucleoid-associated protein [Adhaeribacter sp. BT258]|uniref:Nucleoid-associated protein n=1 Tax=Adhaeribacter terrigena TaxID=2793070 RepID=A0ABS1BY76_9BACT|nr:nucleoid-associated protein [Adhaeribacter terrigena]MBK0402117.1 nucleoid-associated protein [Adhaeribacter terrigena]
MLVTSEVQLESIILHKVGNKSREEGLKLSKGELKLDGFVKELLMKYFLSPFKQEEYFNLHHESDINLNEVFSFCANIFDNPETFHEQSVNLAKHLYEQSNHPKIKEGEFYVTFMKDLVVHGEAVDAIGVFKSESRDTYLKVYPNGDNFDIDSEDGVNINKLDKGALIFNTDRDKGFMVATVDNLNKGNEAQYWREEFLRLKSREDIYFHTSNMMALCKNFVEEHLPEQFEINRADQADLLNKSASYLREKETFNIKEFQQEVIAHPDLIESFEEFKTQYASNNEVPIYDEFDISTAAVKKQAKIMKSIIKLDKNFHVYVHGQASQIVKGYDQEKGMHFYQLFFHEES